jgi:D-alanyl-D-alanine carboxypeptidase (penicillin-binding protein 5/6)
VERTNYKAISFGTWLRARRKKYHLTQAELAERIHCAVVTIRKIEADERRPSPQLAALLADHLAIPIQWRDTFLQWARTGIPPHAFLPHDQPPLSPQQPEAPFIPAFPFTLQATAACLLDAISGHILVDVRRQLRLPIASTTKIMTAIIAIEQADLQQIVTVEQSTIDEIMQRDGFPGAGLIAGDRIALKDLLYATLLPSGDEAACTIARTVSGSTANFVKLMNAYARRLHLTQTHYTNPCGFAYRADGPHDMDHYSTATDLVRLARYALSNPLFAQIVQLQRYILPANHLHHAYTWETTNSLLCCYAGATGIKTGYGPLAGYCLVFSATSGDRHLIGAILQSKGAAQRLEDTRQLLDWGFSLPQLA